MVNISRATWWRVHRNFYPRTFADHSKFVQTCALTPAGVGILLLVLASFYYSFTRYLLAFATLAKKVTDAEGPASKNIDGNSTRGYSIRDLH